MELVSFCVKFYLIDISMIINLLVSDAFDREGGDNGIKELKMGKEFQTNFSSLSFYRQRC